ncbi:MAG: 30S ribosomal protein S3 [Zetaproteobacteria bacterium CG_4_9_14_3_um_filter_49_83]|nr:MAG: 30S ribosomal protein S3 [Zetaproteobacteria bacterium CG1_02_49_23]PIQ32709.1 MAG: 30S ribosomal protein S3 [Zetaproteobacteria bacterium CG17_big_fil_post_rev_8_21_14_2_50_50_13]PIY55314.1 MAG: 30S ribosomal protein S3 [Zetaproteobacteria bacterium CG_4_10_14_0_8_um_filter_49_80]PJA36126.1 MAG: 30S ribosomal protein S3 [Zetaproteobacteria bacterium CG_4_9_14_3_um_filter_49_83]
MGQKVNPIGFRVGINRGWESIWYADKSFGAQLRQDIQLRRFIKKRLAHAHVSRIVIERPADKIKVTVHTARPGVVIGKKGSEIDALRMVLKKEFNADVQVYIVEIRRPEAEAQLVAENISMQLERRVAFRRAMKRSVQSALRMGAKGVRINCSGRLGGADIARMEWYREGRVPLHTLRANVDYGFAEAKTTYGIIGVKVWVFNGENLGDTEEQKA